MSIRKTPVTAAHIQRQRQVRADQPHATLRRLLRPGGVPMLLVKLSQEFFPGSKVLF